MDTIGERLSFLLVIALGITAGWQFMKLVRWFIDRRDQR